MPPIGCQIQKISFRIILSKEGELVRLESTLGSDKTIPEHVVLGDENRTSGIKPFFLCDTAEYLLGYTNDEKKKKKERFEISKEKHLEMEKFIESPEYSAVCRFLEKWDPYNEEEGKEDIGKAGEEGGSAGQKKKEFREDLRKADEEGLFKSFGVFQIEGIREYVHATKSIQHWWDEEGKCKWQDEIDKKEERMCLVSGSVKPIAVLHKPAIKNVLGAQSSGAMLVSFNQESFCSYGERKSSQGLNAPVSEEVAFKYCNALNWLTRSDENRIRLGGDTIVFWSEAPREESAESEQFAMMGLDFKDESKQCAQDSVLTAKLKQSLQELAQGKTVSNSFATPPDTRFFILGISPNAARLSIRFWLESTFGDFVEKLRMHYDALSLVSDFNKDAEKTMITPYRILRESVRRYKKNENKKNENGKKKYDEGEIRSHEVGYLMNSILQGTPYPDTLAISMFNRIKADGEINHIRCSYLKAWLSRKKSPIQIQYMLNKEETNPAYLFGRLFAVLEKTQEESAKGETKKTLNRTVKDSFYASASVTPDVVFPRMIRLNMFHLSKLKKQEGKEGLAIKYEKLIGTILDNIKMHPNPRVLNLMEQGIFALGYYHQKQDFYTKKNAETENFGEE